MTRIRERLNLEALEDRRLLATCHVIQLGDFGVGSDFGGGHSRGDLRYCITKANENSGPDLIDIGVNGRVQIKSPLPDLLSDLEIRGPGADVFAVISSGAGRVFRVFGNVSITGIAITDGWILESGITSGAGIYNSGNLTIRSSIIRDNVVLSVWGEGRGGGIYNTGTLSIFDSTISNNRSYGFTASGGGIYNTGTLFLSGCTVVNNRAVDDFGDGFGGGVISKTSITIINSTFASNRAKWGAGILADGGTSRVSHSTIRANIGPGIEADATVYMLNTIVASNQKDVVGTIISEGYNLIGNTSGGSGFVETDLLNVNPLIGPLAANGGLTKTMALLTGSPAIDAGDPNPVDPPEWDQRGPGFPRIVNGRIDIGAFEVQATGAPLPTDYLAALITADLETNLSIRRIRS